MKSGKNFNEKFPLWSFDIDFIFNSQEVAQFLNLSIPECRAIIERYYEEEERELYRIREK
jgi:hypothetical protein